ncbi:MAG: hypothetical protein OXH07_04070 [Chloroflexi bacterium]|nr:hypothetical protein [Chloroflexota bacterium]
MEPHISLTGLVKFVVASPSQQRKVLRDHKYPDPDGLAQAKYYQEATRAIMAFYRNGHDRSWLEARADALIARKAGASEHAKTKLDSNAAVLRSHAKHFSSQGVDLVESPKLVYVHAGLDIAVTPHLSIMERKQKRLVRLRFPLQRNADETAKVACQVMYEAAESMGLDLPASAFRVWDCRSGKKHKMARSRSRTRSDIEAACETIVDLWPGIRPR